MTATYIISIVLLYLPGAMANMMTVIGSKIKVVKKWNTSIDLGIKYRGIRIIGAHKTFGPAIFGIAIGFVFGLMHYFFFKNILHSSFFFMPQNITRIIVFYFVMSFGAISGDLIKSFFKRQLGKDPHVPWIPFDEIDHSLTSFLLLKIFFPIPWVVIVIAVVIFGILHATANLVGYKLKIKDVPY